MGWQRSPLITANGTNVDELVVSASARRNLLSFEGLTPESPELLLGDP